MNSRCSAGRRSTPWSSIRSARSATSTRRRRRTRPRPRSAILTDNEQCVVEVLKIKNNVTTKQFLAVAEDLPLCKDCKDENAVINAAETLIKMGVVKREFVKGKYLWSLKKELPS